ncbi:hypothetical protein BGZ74_011338 [Mortierella antarctica]|nr:hypothetical protein BGZ74_011338 [Mortierella antarctica]
MHTQTLCPHSNLASGATRYFSTQLRLLKEIGSSPEKSRPVSRSRDSPSRTQRGPISTGTLRKTVMEEVAIPGKYQMYFKPDKRATRKLIKLLEDRKTFQLWYRPKPNDLVTSDQIAEALSKHVHALKAMLARHARQTTSSRLVFQFVRQSDRQAEMDSIWRKLEAEVGRVVEEGKGTDVK